MRTNRLVVLTLAPLIAALGATALATTPAAAEDCASAYSECVANVGPLTTEEECLSDYVACLAGLLIAY